MPQKSFKSYCVDAPARALRQNIAAHARNTTLRNASCAGRGAHARCAWTIETIFDAHYNCVHVMTKY
eukprot:1195848-Prorocentrum_minimum.AAC.4